MSPESRKPTDVIGLLALLLIAALIVGHVVKEHVRQQRDEAAFKAIVGRVKDKVDACRQLGQKSMVIGGKAVVWDMTRDRLSEAHEALPTHLRAGAGDREFTVFLLVQDSMERTGSYGSYFSKARAYRRHLEICVVAWPSCEPLGVHALTIEPPEKIKAPKGTYLEQGEPNDVETDIKRPIEAWIRRLAQQSARPKADEPPVATGPGEASKPTCPPSAAGNPPGAFVVTVTEGPASIKVGMKTLATVSRGTVLQAFRVQGDWVRVRATEGSVSNQAACEGWVHRRHLGVLPRDLPAASSKQ